MYKLISDVYAIQNFNLAYHIEIYKDTLLFVLNIKCSNGSIIY